MNNGEMKILGWQIEDARSLLKFIFDNKNLTLTKAFSIWANNNARQTYSVRNYYYKLINCLRNNKNMYKILKISEKTIKFSVLSKHFSKEQSVWLLENILPNNPKMSVRAKCHILAKGNISEMIRYQNKYRNLIKEQTELVEMVLQKLNAKNIETRNPFKGIKEKAKILNMPIQNDIILDSEIGALFSGILKLVKANAEKAMDIKNKQEKNLVNNALSVALANLRKKDIIINDMSDENAKLKNDLHETQQQLSMLRTQNVSNLTELREIEKSQKMDDLKLFLNKLSSTQRMTLNQPEN